MNLTFHRSVGNDVLEILRYYDSVAGNKISAQFYQEFLLFIDAITKSPEKCHVVYRDLRRCNLKRFPYHILYRYSGETIRILVVRHHRRHPKHGITRK